MAEKRIRNESTGKYYKIRERSSRYGRKGEIMGLWHNDSGKGGKRKKLPPRDESGKFRRRDRDHKERKGFFRRLFGC